MTELKIIRLCDTDVHGDKKIIHGLRGIKGVSFMYANAIVRSLDLDSFRRFDTLTDEEIAKIEEAVYNPSKLNIPTWLLNRRFDVVTGETKHIVGADLQLQKRTDIKRLQDIRTRRGIRHSQGLKVRGQKTKAHPRRAKTVGVSKRKVSQQVKKPAGGKK